MSVAAATPGELKPGAVERPSAERATPARRRSRLTGGVLWIVAIAALLAGVVAVNVRVLQLNVQLSDVERERAKLRGEIAELSARVSWAAGATRIEREARRRGLVRADQSQVSYVTLRGRKR